MSLPSHHQGPDRGVGGWPEIRVAARSVVCDKHALELAGDTNWRGEDGGAASFEGEVHMNGLETVIAATGAEWRRELGESRDLGTPDGGISNRDHGAARGHRIFARHDADAHEEHARQEDAEAPFSWQPMLRSHSGSTDHGAPLDVVAPVGGGWRNAKAETDEGQHPGCADVSGNGAGSKDGDAVCHVNRCRGHSLTGSAAGHECGRVGDVDEFGDLV